MARDRRIRALLTLDGSRWRKGLARANRDLSGFRSQANRSMRGVALAAAGAAAGAGLVGARFEQSLANIASVSVQARGRLGDIEKQARTLGATTAFSASQASDAMFNLALSGMDVNEIIGSSEAVLKFAGATMSDMAQAAELTAISMSTFSDQGVDAARVANVLTRSTQLGLLSFERLDESLKKAAGTSGQFQIKFEETIAALGVFSGAGKFGAEAGTMLRNIILQLTVHAKKYADVLPASIIRTEGLAGVIAHLEKTGVPAELMLERLGTRAGPAFGDLLKIGSKGLRDLTEAVTDTNAAWEAYEIQQNTVRGAFLRVRSALEEVGIVAFRAVDQQLNRTFQSAADTIAAQGPKVAEIMRQVARGFAAIGTWAVNAAEFIREHSRVIKGAAEGALVFAGVLYAVATATKVASTWTLFMSSAVNRWATAIAILAGLLGVAHGKAGSWKNTWDDIGHALEVVWITLRGIDRTLYVVVAAMGEGIALILESITRTFTAALRVVWEFFSSAGKLAAAGWRAIFSRGSLSEAFDQVQSEFTARVSTIADGLVTDIGAAWDGVVERTERGLDQMNDAQEKAIAILKEQRAEQLAARGEEGGLPELEIPEIAIPEVQIPEIPIPDVAGPLQLELDKALIVHDEYQNAVKGTWERGWESLLDVEMTGKQRREMIWDELRRSSFKTVGEIVRRSIWGEQVKWKATKFAQAQQTAATAEGTSTRIALNAAEQQSSAAATTASVQAAAGKTFQAHAGIPFVGIAIAVAMIATMLAFMKGLPKFARGGWIPGEGSRDSVLGMFTPEEYVVQRRPARAFAPVLEGINSGAIPDLPSLASAMGGGGTTINLTLEVSEGSLLVADDDDTWNRIATKLHDVIEGVVKKRYRQR